MGSSSSLSAFNGGQPVKGNKIYNQLQASVRIPNVDQYSMEIILLALQTVGTFDFSDYDLIEFVNNIVIRYVFSQG